MCTDASESMLLTGFKGGGVMIWSLRGLPDLAVRRIYKDHAQHGRGQVVAASLFPDGERAVSCDTGGDLHIWEVESGSTLEIWRDGTSQSAAQRQLHSLSHVESAVAPYVAIAEMEPQQLSPVSATVRGCGGDEVGGSSFGGYLDEQDLFPHGRDVGEGEGGEDGDLEKYMIDRGRASSLQGADFALSASSPRWANVSQVRDLQQIMLECAPLCPVPYALYICPVPDALYICPMPKRERERCIHKDRKTQRRNWPEHFFLDILTAFLVRFLRLLRLSFTSLTFG